MTDWDAELKKIDKQLESMSDSALIPAAPKNAPPAAKAQVATERATTRTWGAFLRLALATALGVGILFWPYPHGCGIGLAGYLVAIAAIVAGGVWSSIWTWRHRTARAHVLSLLLVTWGLVLGAIEILPRTGYAAPDATRPSGWMCVAPAQPASAQPTSAQPAPAQPAPAAVPQ
jgi:putative flippase GtrA